MRPGLVSRRYVFSQCGSYIYHHLVSADDWAEDEEGEEDDGEEENGESSEMKATVKKKAPKPKKEKPLVKKAHMNIIFIGHVGKWVG